MLGLAFGMQAQNGGNSKASRSVNEIRQECGGFYFQGNNWNVYAVFETTVRCEVNSSTTGLGDVYMVIASYNCQSEICPAIADVVIGRVFFCGNDIVNHECY